MKFQLGQKVRFLRGGERQTGTARISVGDVATIRTVNEGDATYSVHMDKDDQIWGADADWLEPAVSSTQLRFKKLHPDAVTPKYAKTGDACFDLTLIDDGAQVLGKDDSAVGFHFYVVHRTGLAFEIPAGHVGLIFPRSSSRDKAMTLANCVGVIDSGYRGEVTVSFRLDGAPFVLRECKHVASYKKGERAVQMMIVPIPKIELVDVGDAELSSSERGATGHGSSGA